MPRCPNGRGKLTFLVPKVRPCALFAEHRWPDEVGTPLQAGFREDRRGAFLESYVALTSWPQGELPVCVACGS